MGDDVPIGASMRENLSSRSALQLCYSFSGKYDMHNFNILASLCSWNKQTLKAIKSHLKGHDKQNLTLVIITY